MKGDTGPEALAILVILALLIPGFLATSSVKAEGLKWVQTINPSAGTDEANGVAVDGTGVYVVGSDNSPGGFDFAWRMEKRDLSAGTIIWTQTTNPSTSFDIAWGVAVDSTGVYVVGFDDTLGGVNRQWRIEKRDLSTGAIIWTHTSSPSTGDDQAYKVAVDGTGIYVVGYDNSPGGADLQWRIEKRDRGTGAIIWTQTTNPSSGDDRARAIAVDATGLYLAGSDTSPGDYQWRLEKRDLLTGAIIWSQTSNPSTGIDSPRGVVVEATGVYVVGYDNSPGGGNWEWRIEKRDLATGTLIWTQTSNPTANDDRASGVAVDSTGIYVAGDDNPSGADYEWRIEKRNLATGVIMWAQTSNPSGAPDSANAVTVDSTGIYVVGYDHSPGNREWRIEKRETGAPVPDFSLSSSTSTVTVAQGGTGSATITATSLNGFSSGVTLTASWVGTAPAGVTFSLPSPITPPSGGAANSPLTFMASSIASVGTFTFRVTATSGSLTHVLTPDITLQITAATTTTSSVTTTPIGPDFSIASSTSSISISQGSSSSATVTITSLSGFSSAVMLVASWVGTAPTDVNFALPSPITPSTGGIASSPLTITAGPSASVGAFMLRVTGTSGSLTHTVSPDISVQVTAAGTTTTTTTTPEAPRCLVATAAYGSELAPEVQLLRNFRDNAILKTSAGSNFMVAFNAWYYSFSPSVANYVSDHWVERTMMKGLLYPLIGILLLSSSVYSVAGSYPEVAALLSGLLASSSIGAFYLGLPLGILRAKIRRLSGIRPERSLEKLLAVTLLGAIGALVAGEMLASSFVLMVSTSAVVVSMLFLSAAFVSSRIAQKI